MATSVATEETSDAEVADLDRTADVCGAATLGLCSWSLLSLLTATKDALVSMSPQQLVQSVKFTHTHSYAAGGKYGSEAFAGLR